MKFINQRDYPDWLYVTRTDMEDAAQREKGRTTTVASSACGLCAAAMVADRLLVNHKFDLKAALKLSYDTKANHEIGTDYDIYAPAFADQLGLDWESTNDPERLRHCLRTGGAAVILVGGDREGRVGVFSHSEHYVTAVSEDRDGRIVILDPYWLEGKYEEKGRSGLVEVKNRFIATCDMQVLIDDTAGCEPCFYLFWRK